MNKTLRVFALALLLGPLAAFADVSISITASVAPPPLPVYEQPPVPGPGYIWTPGYWAWSPDGYYWVPGTWVLAPQPGLLWTPGWWGWSEGVYVWHPGYWGPHVGFYGGVNYGFGYTGSGFQGGYWHDGAFFYNRSVANVTNVTNVTNVYNTTVVNNVNVTRVSYNGGAGGVAARPSAQELAYEHENHLRPTEVQLQHEQTAHGDRTMFAAQNGGRPPIAATPRPGAFRDPGVVHARAEEERPAAAPRYEQAQHPPSASFAPHGTPAQAGAGQPPHPQTQVREARAYAPPEQNRVQPRSQPAMREAPRPRERAPAQRRREEGAPR